MAGRVITIGSGPRAGTKIDVDADSPPPQAPGGTNDEGQQETVDEAVDRMAGTPSNAGKQAQSSDSMNKYQ